MLWFNFIPSLNLYPLFWAMVMYDNEFKTNGNKIQTKDKIEPQHTQSFIKPVFPGYYKLPCFPFYQTAFPVVQPLALLNLDQHLEINAESRKKNR